MLYGYDALGNLVSDGNTSSTYTTCTGTALSSPTSPSETLACIRATRGTVVQWTAYHDSEGKRTRFTEGAITDYYSYDYKQRLNAVIRAGVARKRYVYNFAGDRVIEIHLQSDGSETNTFHVGKEFELQRHSSDPNRYSVSWYIGDVSVITEGDLLPGQASAATVTANQNRMLEGSTGAGNGQGTYVMHHDRWGSTVSMTQPTLTSPEATRYFYDPWGKIDRTRGLGYSTTSVRYTGQWHDDDTGLIYFGARYYDPRSRRFLTADDRIVGNGLDPQGYNRFAYALNNPARKVDPSGHQPGDVEEIEFAEDEGARIKGNLDPREQEKTEYAAYLESKLPPDPWATLGLWYGASFVGYLSQFIPWWTFVGYGGYQVSQGEVGEGLLTAGMGLLVPTLNLAKAGYLAHTLRFLKNAPEVGLTAAERQNILRTLVEPLLSQRPGRINGRTVTINELGEGHFTITISGGGRASEQTLQLMPEGRGNPRLWGRCAEPHGVDSVVSFGHDPAQVWQYSYGVRARGQSVTEFWARPACPNCEQLPTQDGFGWLDPR